MMPSHDGAAAKSETVLILGATGFLGTAIGEQLAREGYGLVLFARQRPEALHPYERDAEWIEGDASDASAYEHVLDRVTHVVYALTGLLPKQSNDNPLDDVHRTLTPLIHLLEALRTRPHIKLVFLSSDRKSVV